MKKQLLTFSCAAAIAALCSLPAFASGDDSASPTPSPSPSPSASPTASPVGFDDHGGTASPSPTASVSPSASASPSATASPFDDHGGTSPSTSPSATASPIDDHGDRDGGSRGDLSLHGIYEGTTSSGGIAVFYVEKNSHVQVNIMNLAGHTIGFAEGDLLNGSFAFTLSDGENITGTVAEHVISGTVGGATFEAARAAEFGTEHNATGRFAGVAHGPDGESSVLFVIDPDGNILLIQLSGTAPNLVRTGGVGKVTAPIAPSITYTFTLDKTIGSASAITGSFTVIDGVFQGTFTTSAGTFTVNSFKSTLVNRMANISTRGLVGAGQGQLIGGFIITGGPKLVMIRALGPSLAAFGVSPALDNPALQLFANQTPLATNDDWKTNANAAEIVASGLAPTNDLDSALLVRLEPGAYTTIVTGSATGGTAIGLVEIYEVGND